MDINESVKDTLKDTWKDVKSGAAQRFATTKNALSDHAPGIGERAWTAVKDVGSSAVTGHRGPQNLGTVFNRAKTSVGELGRGALAEFKNSPKMQLAAAGTAGVLGAGLAARKFMRNKLK